MRVALTAVLLGALQAAMPAQAAWTNIGPFGGEVQAFASSNRTVYALNARSGVFRSADGRVWNPSFDALARGVTATSIAVDSQTSRAYVGTTGGLFRSDDEGLSWRMLRSERIYAVAASIDHVIISTKEAILRSGDAGGSWNRGGDVDAPDPVSVLRMHPHFPERTAAVASGKLFRSDDFGTSWKELTAKNIVTAEFGDTLYAAGASGIYSCDDDCAIMRGDAAVGLAYWQNSLYVAVPDGVLHLNITQWERLINGTPTVPIITIVGVPSALMLGTTAGVFRSEDGGGWVFSSDGLTNVKIVALTATDGGLFAATQAPSVVRRVGGTWTTLDPGLPLQTARVLASDTSTAFAGYSDTGLFRTTNDRPNWDDLSGLMPSRTLFDLAADAGTAVAATFGGLSRSVDHGATWQRLTSFPGAWASAVAVKEKMIVAGLAATVYISRDSGATWTTSEVPSTIRQVAIANGRVFVRTDDDLLSQTTTGWRSTIGVLPPVITIYSSGTTLYAATHQGIFSSDSGAVWTLVRDSDSLPPDITALVADSAMLYAGTNGGSVFATQIFTPRQRSVRH